MSSPQRNSWLYCLNSPEQPEHRLICLPHAGGAPTLFRQWPAALPDEIEIIGVQLSGRGSRLHEAPFERIQPLLQALMPVLRTELTRLQVQARVPVAFFGHSLGALLAFELVHALQADAIQLSALFVSACHAPQQFPVEEKLHDLPRSELLAAVQRFEGIPRQLLAEAELLDMILPAFRADMAVYETYVYRQRPKLSVPIIACGGRNDVRVSPAELEAWREQAAGHFEQHLFEGNHFYLNDARPQLLQLIERTLAP